MFEPLTTEEKLRQKLAIAEDILQLVATPRRPDGTYNRCREACEILARDALERIQQVDTEGSNYVQST